MRFRTVLAIALAVLLALTSACSSSTVFEADTSVPVNEAPADDVAASTNDANDDADSDAAATPEPAPTELGASADSDSADRDRNDLGALRQAQFEGLAELCRSDNTQACDVLFLISEIGSDYETLGNSCNGNVPAESGWCTDGLITGIDGLVFDDASPALNGIAADCTDGDMMACDFLYFFSAPGGQWEDFGDGCGGRTNSAFPDCRTEFSDS